MDTQNIAGHNSMQWMDDGFQIRTLHIVLPTVTK
jgi:hypothetical protein